MKKELLQSVVLREHYSFDSYAEREKWCAANMDEDSSCVLGHNNDLYIEVEEDENGRSPIYEVVYSINKHEQLRLKGDRRNIQSIASFILATISDAGSEYEFTQEPNSIHINELSRNEGAGEDSVYLNFFDFDKPFTEGWEK